MNKRVYQFTSIIIVLALTLGTHSNGQAISAQASVMPGNVVNLAFFYKPPKNSTAVEVAQNFNTAILTHKDEIFRNQLTANGFQSTIMQYLRFESIMDPGNCTNAPMNNQVAYKPGDFCAISQDHPDWFLLDASGNRLTAGGPGDSYYMMDPGNQEWREFWLSRALELQQSFGWSALFLDNVEATLGSRKNASGVPAKYPDNASYQAAIRGFLNYLSVNYAKAYQRPLFANIVAAWQVREIWFDYLTFLDGALMERWSVDWLSTGNYLDKATWEADLVWAEKTQSLGKSIILVVPGNQTDTNRQNFGFASYLLISNGKAAFRYSSSGYYQQVWLYDNYQVDLGQPLGPRYQSGDLWRRDFTKGFVIVDPVNHTATISTNPPSVSTSTATPTVLPTKTLAPPTATPLPPTEAIVQPTSTIAPTTTPIQPTWTPIQPSATPIILPTETVVQPTATALPPTEVIAQPTTTLIPTAAASSETIYDNGNPAFVYSSGWRTWHSKKAYGGSYKLTMRDAATITLPFTGQSFSIIYKGGITFGKLDVYIDDLLVGTINQKQRFTAYQQRWDYPGQLPLGQHTLKLVFKFTSKSIINRSSLDAVLIR